MQAEGVPHGCPWLGACWAQSRPGEQLSLAGHFFIQGRFGWFFCVFIFFFRKVTAFKGIDTFLAKKYCNPSQNTLTDRKKKEINLPVFSFSKVKSPKCCQKWIHSQAL